MTDKQVDCFLIQCGIGVAIEEAVVVLFDKSVVVLWSGDFQYHNIADFHAE